MADSGCRKCGEEGHFSRECPSGGGGDNNKCRNCKQEGHMASDCPEPEVCRRCKQEGHISTDCPIPQKCFNCQGEGHGSSDCPEPEKCRRCKQEGHMSADCPLPQKCYNCQGEGHGSSDCPEPEKCRRCKKEGHTKEDCPEPAKCYNCREEGHETPDCPEPEKCRRCKKEGHKVMDCPEPQICNNCGVEGHMQRECPEPEKTRQYVDDEGVTKEIYVPGEEISTQELYKAGIASGINFDKYDDIEVKVTGENIPKHIADFKQAGLRPILMENVTKSGYIKPTPVQRYGIPIISAGRDLMACAQTGSGKTAAFLLPILHKLVESQADSGTGSSTAKPQCLVITPTRELAIQIHNEARKFSQGSMIKSVVAYGGTSVGYQAQQMTKGCNVLVATPGRLIDYMEKGRISFSNLQFLVLDEADRMLDMGFMPEIQKMVEHASMPPADARQTVMFSATFPDDIQTAAQEFLKNYLFVVVGMIGGACSDVAQEFHQVAKFDKREKLQEILQDPDRNPTERTLVFVQTKKNADFLATFLSGEGIPTTSIHGDRMQREREEALYDFRAGTHPILVATAVAARGLDIPGVMHVVNYDMPTEVDEYVHRIGRTGRVGNTGKATSFFDDEHDADVAGPLVEMLAKNEVALPDWLAEAGAGGSGGGGGGGDAADDDDGWD